MKEALLKSSTVTRGGFSSDNSESETDQLLRKDVIEDANLTLKEPSWDRNPWQGEMADFSIKTTHLKSKELRNGGRKKGKGENLGCHPRV